MKGILFAGSLLAGLVWVRVSYAQTGRAYNAAYTGVNNTRVAFPLGGMGAGMFTLEGTGAVSHMSVRNNPDLFNEPTIFAALYVKGQPAKVLEGPVPAWKKFGLPDNARGGE